MKIKFDSNYNQHYITSSVGSILVSIYQWVRLNFQAWYQPEPNAYNRWAQISYNEDILLFFFLSLSIAFFLDSLFFVIELNGLTQCQIQI